jgi:hypothetical protein
MSLRHLTAVAAGLALFFANPTVALTVNSAQIQRYDAGQRCGGIERPWRTIANLPKGDLMPVRNRLRISRHGTMLWNDTPVSKATLRTYASVVSRMNPIPMLDLVLANGAPCGLVKEIRERFSLPCSRTACVEYSEADWRKYNPPVPACDAHCRAYGRAGGSFKGLTQKQKGRLKANYLDKYGFIPW